VNGDTIDEPTERYAVNLSSPTNATIADGQGIGTIVDNDVTPAISIDNVAVVEGNSGTKNAVFHVTLSNPSAAAVSVNFATAGDTATSGVDFTPTSGTLSFSPGQTSKTVTVAVKGDTIDEGASERFFVNLGGAVNASIADARGTAYIRDDDPDDPAILLSKTGPPTASAGTIVTYTISYKNLGPLASRNTHVADSLPSGVSFHSASSGGSYSAATRKVTWGAATVDVGESGSVWVKVRIPSTVSDGTLLVDRADFSGDGTNANPAFASTLVQ
jgi:uncharacterized repeat protein (TIGR01451 family)